MRRVAATVILMGSAWMALSGEAQAQVQIMPTGPLPVALPAVAPALEMEQDLDLRKFYPGRTMGGGPRILRSNPPPSSLKRRKE